MGGGSVEIACSKYLDLKVIGFDIFDILMNYWQVQIDTPKDLFQKLSRFSPDKKTYEKVKEKLKAHWEKRKELPPLDLAAYFYFNHNANHKHSYIWSWNKQSNSFFKTFFKTNK